MKKFLTAFWKEEDGMGTVEMVIIIGILVALALLFREKIFEFVNNIFAKTINPDSVAEEITG